MEEIELTRFKQKYKKEKEEAKRKRKLEEESQSKLSKEKRFDEKLVQEDAEVKFKVVIIKCILIIDTVEAA